MRTNDTQQEQALLAGNKMRLIDGRVIDIYPRKELQGSTGNTPSVDTTGEFLAFNKNAGRRPTPPDAYAEDELQFFLDNVFFFVAHCEEILGDSRMFLAQVPVQNGLACTGTSCFRNPTLGVYLEWWMHFGQTVVAGEDGKLRFYWLVSGNPLSGSNACAVVDEKGVTEKRPVGYFPNYWRTFMYVNMRYSKCKAVGEAYTLQQVKDLLSQGSNGNYLDKAYLNGYRWLNHWLIEERENARKQAEEASLQIKYLKMDLRADEMKHILAEYREQTQESATKVEALRERARDAKARLKRGEITDKEYQQSITAMKKRIEQLEKEPGRQASSKLGDIFGEQKEHVSLNDLIAWETDRAGAK